MHHPPPPHPMRVPGKCISWPTVNTASAGDKNKLFSLSDKKSGQRYLVDTGAQISIIPALHFDCFSHKLTHLLVAANGTSIKTYETRFVPLNFNQKNFQCCFTVADIAHPLLGADFLQAHS